MFSVIYKKVCQAVFTRFPCVFTVKINATKKMTDKMPEKSALLEGPGGGEGDSEAPQGARGSWESAWGQPPCNRREVPDSTPRAAGLPEDLGWMILQGRVGSEFAALVIVTGACT